MSWQTPLPLVVQASCALVCTPVDPGDVRPPCSRTKSATASAAVVRARPADDARAASRQQRGVDGGQRGRRQQLDEPVAAPRAAPSSSQPSQARDRRGRRRLSTTLCPVTSSSSCGSCRSNAVTWVPQ